MRMRWTDPERAILRQHYVRDGARACVAALHEAGFARTRTSVYQEVVRLGLASKVGSAQFRDRCARRNMGKRLSPKTEFKKGNVPWTKGLKGIRLSPATEFQPGCLRGNAARRYNGLGTCTIRRDKTGKRRRFIKVRDDGPTQYRYIPLARHLWEREHGPLAAGFFVVHRNGDTLDDDLANLCPMTHGLLIKWQRRICPDMEARRRAASSVANRKRHLLARQVKAARQAILRERVCTLGEGLPTLPSRQA